MARMADAVWWQVYPLDFLGAERAGCPATPVHHRLDRLPGVPRWVVADRGYSSRAFREHVWAKGGRPAIPGRRNEAPVACPAWIYNNRDRVERLRARLKEWRAVATRYEKTARSFIGVLCLAAACDWIRR